MATKSKATDKKNTEIKGWFQRAKDYFSGVYTELKKVHWPGRKQLIAYTGVVLVSVALVGLIIWLFDNGLGFLLDVLFNAFA